MTRIVKKNRSSEFKDDMTCRHCDTGPEELQKHLKTSTWTESERREPGDMSKEENKITFWTEECQAGQNAQTGKERAKKEAKLKL